MSKRVIFRIERGDFEQGFPVTLLIKENGEVCAPEVKGKLAPAPEIIARYNDWQKAYYSWGKSCRWWRRKLDIPEQIDTNYSSAGSEDNADNYAHQFEATLNEWLDRSDLGELREELLHTVNRNEPVSFIVQTDNKELQKLPWELWRLLKNRYHQAEVALSIRSAPRKGALKTSLKILAILGSDEKIDIKTDWSILKGKLPNDELILLEKPSAAQFRETLMNQHWDILFFAGHSSTQTNGDDAGIWLNDNDKEYLSPQQLKMCLEKSVVNGLIAVEVARESVQSMQQSVAQLAESVATAVAAYEKVKAKYTAKQHEFKQAENQALLAYQQGHEEAARLAMSRAIALERLLPKMGEQVAQAEKVVVGAREKLHREREKLEAYQTEMQNLKALAEINEALETIAQVDSSLDINSARYQFESAQAAVEERYLRANAQVELSENPAERLQSELDHLMLNDEISRRFAQLKAERS